MVCSKDNAPDNMKTGEIKLTNMQYAYLWYEHTARTRKIKMAYKQVMHRFRKYIADFQRQTLNIIRVWYYSQSSEGFNTPNSIPMVVSCGQLWAILRVSGI